MAQELDQSIKLKNDNKERARTMAMAPDNYDHLAGVGANYNKQLQRQQRIEHSQRLHQQQYNLQVRDSAAQKALNRVTLEDNRQQEVRQRYDRQKDLIDQQKLQAHRMNMQQIQMQINEKNVIKEMNDSSFFNKEQAKLQAEQNRMLNEQNQKQKRDNQLAYKQMLDQ